MTKFGEHLDKVKEMELLERMITGPFEEPMSGSDIGRKLGITRQAVSSSLKKALPKYFKGFQELNPDMDEWEIFWEIAKSTGMMDEPDKLLKLFPKNIKKQIEKKATHHRRIKK